MINALRSHLTSHISHLSAQRPNVMLLISYVVMSEITITP